jgi:hypothetical protein
MPGRARHAKGSFAAVLPWAGPAGSLTDEKRGPASLPIPLSPFRYAVAEAAAVGAAARVASAPRFGGSLVRAG